MCNINVTLPIESWFGRLPSASGPNPPHISPQKLHHIYDPILNPRFLISDTFQSFNCTHLCLEGSTTFSFHLRRIGFHSISPAIWVNIVNLHYCVCFPFPVATTIGRFSTAFIIFQPFFVVLADRWENIVAI